MRGLGFSSNRRAERPARGRRCSQRLTRGSHPRAGEHFREGRLAARALGAPRAAPSQGLAVRGLQSHGCGSEVLYSPVPQLMPPVAALGGAAFRSPPLPTFRTPILPTAQGFPGWAIRARCRTPGGQILLKDSPPAQDALTALGGSSCPILATSSSSDVCQTSPPFLLSLSFIHH